MLIGRRVRQRRRRPSKSVFRWSPARSEARGGPIVGPAGLLGAARLALRVALRAIAAAAPRRRTRACFMSWVRLGSFFTYSNHISRNLNFVRPAAFEPPTP